MSHSNRVIIFWGAKDKKSLTRNFRTYFHNIIFLYCKVMNMNLKKNAGSKYICIILLFLWHQNL